MPVLEYYEQMGMVSKIDGERGIVNRVRRVSKEMSVYPTGPVYSTYYIDSLARPSSPYRQPAGRGGLGRLAGAAPIAALYP
eukprot:scaffold46840_cov42-Phaeocystis_antarctica.AAC.1